MKIAKIQSDLSSLTKRVTAVEKLVKNKSPDSWRRTGHHRRETAVYFQSHCHRPRTFRTLTLQTRYQHVFSFQEKEGVTYSLQSGALPKNFTLNSKTGELKGTAPAVTGNVTYTFTIRATDLHGSYTDRKFTLEVTDNPYVPGHMVFKSKGTSSQTFVVPLGVPSSDHPLTIMVWGAGGGKGGEGTGSITSDI